MPARVSDKEQMPYQNALRSIWQVRKPLTASECKCCQKVLGPFQVARHMGRAMRRSTDDVAMTHDRAHSFSFHPAKAMKTYSRDFSGPAGCCACVP